MVKIWVAEFGSKASLKTAEFVKETDRMIFVKEETAEVILGWSSYLPGRLDKSKYNIFMSGEEALDFLITEAEEAISAARERLAKAEAEHCRLVEIMAAGDDDGKEADSD